MIIPRSSSAFQANAIELIREYYNYEFNFTDTIDDKFFEWKGAIRTLLCNVLTEFTYLTDHDKRR
ncbi:MAG: hypothetical protein LKE55_09525 [Prevotella sp.]|jgi:hypothetical protein|nr:hypothetical protein [Prevotella sp.]